MKDFYLSSPIEKLTLYISYPIINKWYFILLQQVIIITAKIVDNLCVSCHLGLFIFCIIKKTYEIYLTYLQPLSQ